MRNSNFAWSLLLVATAFGQHAFASSFVGNGGNAGDVEWIVALKQIEAAVDGISKDPPDDQHLCTCNGTYSNHSICEALKSLTKEQATFCGQTLKAQLPMLKNLVTDSRNVRVDWTRDTIEVLEQGQRRAVDAVTDRTQGKVTLNAERFTQLNASERVFLISHELMHLTSLNGLPLTDEGPQGPFTTVTGSRQLINSMAAALVVEADEARAFDRYRGSLNRPQGWRDNWIDVSFASAGANGKSVYGIEKYSGFRGRYTHFFNDLGLNVGFIQLKGEKLTLTTIQSNETSKTVQVGVSYRVFPFKDPLTFFGQSHLILSADVDFVNGEFNLHSGTPNETDQSKRVGASAEARYNFPVAANFWLSVAEAYESLPASYTLFNNKIENESNVFATYLGVSFGF